MLIVQNDLGTIPNANAYADIAYVADYFATRNITTWTGSVIQQEAAIIKSTDYIDNRFNYSGRMLVNGQTTRFPRDKLYNASNYEVLGIPDLVKKACAEYALRALTTALATDPIYDPSGSFIIGCKVKVDVIERDFTYSESGGKITYKSYPLADMYLREFIENNRAVSRG